MSYAESAIMRAPSQGKRGFAQITQDTAVLRISNPKVEFIFDLGSGAMKQVRLKSEKRTFSFHASAAAPIRVWVGTPEQPDYSEAFISQATRQPFTYRVYNYSGGVAVEFAWQDLRDRNGEETGIALQQFCMLDDDSEFLRLRTYIANRGDFLLTGLFLGLQDISLGSEAAEETFSAPTGGMGQQWLNPREKQSERPIIFCVPPTPPIGLVCGWLDFSAPAFGFGTGYLNRKGMDMIGEARFGPTTASVGWRLFRLQGGWAFMEKHNGPLQVYPLRPGEDFTTDEWFLGFHRNDWHATARHYRREYERVFEGDFLTWEKTSPAARNADVIYNTTAAWGVMRPDKKGYDMTKGELRHRFLTIPAQVKKAIEASGVRPENTLVVMLGQATHWGIYKLPDYFPVNQEAGGPEDFKEMIRQLRQEVGVAGTHFYAHPCFNHPEANNYVKEADTGWDANLYFDFSFLGRIADMDAPEWWALWRDKIIPSFAKAGASGIEFDEGFGHHFIPFKQPRFVNASAETILTSQVRGALRIFRECRRAFGPEGYLECEGGSDVGARYFDLWASGGKALFELVRYTHPDKLITIFSGDTEAVSNAFIYGSPILHQVGHQVSSTQAYKQFVQMRRELREQKAPGYPYGFRDNIGLSIPDGSLRAKVYADQRGITVAYYAVKAAALEIVVDGRELGHPKIGVQHRKLNLEDGQLGYWIVWKPQA